MWLHHLSTALHSTTRFNMFFGGLRDFFNEAPQVCHIRGHCGYGLSQWETTLQCNVVSKWLISYPKLSLHTVYNIILESMTTFKFYNQMNVNFCFIISNIITWIKLYAETNLYTLPGDLYIHSKKGISDWFIVMRINSSIYSHLCRCL